MKSPGLILQLVIVMLLVGVGADRVTAVEISTVAGHDATIFSDPDNVSDGAGAVLFVGRNNSGNRVRRALVRFDVEGLLPMWATVDSAKLTMWVNRTQVGNRTISIHRITSDWNEGPGPGSGGGAGGTALIGDVTWEHTNYNTQSWTSDGGDFVGAGSASTSVGSQDVLYTWGSNANMVGDVNGWFAKPDSNFGWILIGDETQRSSKRFDSRESSTDANRPRLTVWYTPWGECQCAIQADMNADGAWDAVDLNSVIDALYFDGIDPQDPICPTNRADLNADGHEDMMDLEYLIDILFFGGAAPINPCGL